MTLIKPISDAGKSRTAQVERLVKAATERLSRAVDAGESWLERPLRQLRVAEELLGRDDQPPTPEEDVENAA